MRTVKAAIDTASAVGAVIDAVVSVAISYLRGRLLRMVFTPPTLPSKCNVCDGGTFTPRTANVSCAIRSVDAEHRGISYNATANSFPLTSIIFPPRQDVRSIYEGVTTGDWLEVPPGSGWGYAVVWVSDCYRDFPNEFRVAWCIPIQHLGAGARP